MSGLGLVELTRERRGPSLAARTVLTCRRPTLDQLADRALRALLAESLARPAAALDLVVAPPLAARLGALGQARAEVETRLGRPLSLRPAPGLGIEDFHVEDTRR